MANRETHIGPAVRQYNDKGQFLGIGVAERGTCTREEMIEAYRRYHQYEFELHKRALEIPDNQLKVSVFEGSKKIKEF